MRKLYFSNGSPFARRVRIVLEEKALEYDQDIFDALRPIEQIKDITPTLQVPVLQDAGRTLWSSNLIIAYLFENYPEGNSRDMERPLASSVFRPTFRWEDQLLLETISTLADSIVNLRLMRSGRNDPTVTYLDRQVYRIKTCLDWLEERVTLSGFWPGTFSVMDISLLCPLLFAETQDVFQYRDSGWPKIVEMIDVLQKRKSVISTEINQS